jgi:hypothetical protein
MRTTISVLAALAIAAPLAAQQQAGKEHDATNAVAPAAMPAGWSQRLDDKDATKAAKFVTMGQGYHVTSGGAAIYYNSKDAQTSAPYSVMASFRQTKKITEHGEHGEAFGLFAAGKDLNDSDKQTYYYFIVRQDGMFMINHRAGKEVHKLVDWTANPAVHKFDENPSNDLEIKVGTDSTRFFVNKTQVHAIKTSDMSGEAGIRVNHNLDVHVGNFMVMKGM